MAKRNLPLPTRLTIRGSAVLGSAVILLGCLAMRQPAGQASQSLEVMATMGVANELQTRARGLTLIFDPRADTVVDVGRTSTAGDQAVVHSEGTRRAIMTALAISESRDTKACSERAAACWVQGASGLVSVSRPRVEGDKRLVQITLWQANDRSPVGISRTAWRVHLVLVNGLWTIASIDRIYT
jgi:hypothetical protein